MLNPAFLLAAAASAIAAVYHTTALAVPAFAQIAYPPSYPVWRHVAFIVIDGTFAWLLLRRPIWLIWPYAALTVQAVNSHGGDAWRLWRQAGRIDWISVIVVIGMPLVLALLFVDWRERRAIGSAATGRGETSRL